MPTQRMIRKLRVNTFTRAYRKDLARIAVGSSSRIRWPVSPVNLSIIRRAQFLLLGSEQDDKSPGLRNNTDGAVPIARVSGFREALLEQSRCLGVIGIGCSFTGNWRSGESGVRHLVKMVWRGEVLLNSKFFLCDEERFLLHSTRIQSFS